MSVLDFRFSAFLRRNIAGWWLLFLGCSLVGSAQTPKATELPGSVFSIRKTWTIGGEGNWDYLTLDPSALLLYIAHGTTVQVVDVNEGKIAGEVTGLRDAHEIALDGSGQYGYVSDGAANEVKVFDRRSLEVVARIPTGKNPRSVVFDSASHMIFVICPSSTEESKIPRRIGDHPPIRQSADATVRSTITVIDGDTQKRLADILFPGKLGFAQADDRGTVYVNLLDRNAIASFHTQGLSNRLRAMAANGTDPALTIDWSDMATQPAVIPKSLFIFPLQDCQSPKGLAIDGANGRVFTTCENMKMEVLNAESGALVATLPIGAGNDAIGYDPERGLIYASNGGGVGSLTIIRQHLTDSYAVIEEMPTQARARTLAVNPNSGEVYLVTNVTGFDLTHKGGVGDLKPAPVLGSFQVLVVGN
jgi:YVTN family beta-propeller protein